VNISLRDTSEPDATAVSAFLTRMLKPQTPSSYAPDAHMQWKYWTARSDWEGSRSFTAGCNGTIHAHAAAWPVRICVPGELVSAVHVIDWAADPAYPGAGLWLMRQIVARAGLAIATGGSEITRRILPLIGFRARGELWWLARPLRPVAQARTIPVPAWRAAAKLARNAAWNLTAPASSPRGWSAHRVASDEIPGSLWPQPSAAVAVTARDADFYRYVLSAPSPRHELFVVAKQGEPAGYFCLAFAPHVARIADLWLTSTEIDDWCNAVRTATATAAARPDVYEVTALASTSFSKTAVCNAGFRVRNETAISFAGDDRFLDGRTLHLQMLDCDASIVARDKVSSLP
jgi:hypothetical protein